MNTFQRDMIDGIVSREGGYESITDDPNDRGGFTRAGITAKTFAGEFGLTVSEAVRQLKDMSQASIADFYYNTFIEKPGFAALPNAIITPIVDFGVMAGSGNAVKIMQRVCNTHSPHGNKAWQPLAVDGVLGEKTLLAFRNICALYPPAVVEKAIFKERVAHHVADCKKNPSQLEYLQGWINRACLFI